MAKKKSYLELRMAALGATPEDCIVRQPIYEGEPEKSPIKEWIDHPLFTIDDEQNIIIHYCNRLGARARYWKGKNKQGTPYNRTRFKNPLKDKKTGDDIKYLSPTGAGTFPFLPPSIIEKYRNSEVIKTLVITEGEFKAFKGSLHGLDIIALPGINHFRDKETLKLHEDIHRIILRCQVQFVVWLVDGDCAELTRKWEEDKSVDLYKRPNLFFRGVQAIKTLLNELDLKIYFAHPKSADIEGNPKGLDDLYTALLHKDVDPLTVSAELTTHSGHYQYFQRFDITTRTDEVRRYFCLDKVENFYHRHEARIKSDEFVFNRTKYRYNSQRQECEVMVPADARNYFRVGCHYWKMVECPNKYGQTENFLDPWQQGTIVSDKGKDFLKHIAKLERFCNVPDHQNFQPIIANCYNRYYAFEHTDRNQGDWGNTKAFIEHIFGTDKVKVKRKGLPDLEVSEYDLGLDYIQILYRHPQQVLPILCLVSKERSTGKTTFMKYLKAIFNQNAVFVGNDDLSNDFNASWASRLLVLCEEVLIDKKQVAEKVKALSTADKIMVNAKGRDQIEMEFFAKFVFASNNENSFMHVDGDEIRFWVRKINPIKREDDDVELLDKMIEEIPHFLYFLDQRKMATERLSRMWFHPDLIKTEALKRVVEYSRPTAIKEITSNVREMFMDFDRDEIMLTTDKVREVLLGGSKRYENNYLDKLLTDDLHLSRLKDANGKTIVTRYTYPKWEDAASGSTATRFFEIKDQGRPWVFKREEFMTADEAENVVLSDELKYGAAVMNGNGHGTYDPTDEPIILTKDDNGTLPFEEHFN